MKLAFLFRTAPHGNAISREGLDALLAATAFCDEEEIGVFFIDDGVLNLLDGQNPELLLQKILFEPSSYWIYTILNSALSAPIHSTNTICKQNNSLFLLKN